MEISDEDKKLRDLFEKRATRKSTEDLLSYDDFSIKEELFGENLYFTDSSKFFNFTDDLVNQIIKERLLIFRGVGKASYRLFNKAQRNFRSNNSHHLKNETMYHNSISQMLENAKNIEQNVLANYFNSFGAQENDVAVLSFLHHYGAPTPLLDWTYDFYVALFFALNDLTKLEFKPQHSNENMIDNFFSIYLMSEQMPQYMINDYKKLSISTSKGLSYQTFKKRKTAHISEVYRNGKPKLFLENNFRILKQKGLFVFNNSSYLPLEEVFFIQSFMYYLIRSSKGDFAPLSPIVCINIHKSLATSIKKKLNTMGYNKASLFLDPKRVASLSVPKSLT